MAVAISVNIDSSNAAGIPAIGSGVTAGVVPVANWNNITSGAQTGTTTGSALVNDGGATTAASVTVFNRFWQDQVSTASGDHQIYSEYTNTSATANGVVNVAGIGTGFTSNGYNVIVYLGGTNDMGANTAIEVGANINGGTDQWIRVIRRSPSFNGAWDSTPFSTEPLAQASAAESNYIMFTGLTASSFDINILKDPSSTNSWSRAGLRGIQIVAVPEPSSAALLGLGGLALFLRRRR